jgi:hypothetical protein
VFIPGKPFQLSLMFDSKAGAYPSEAIRFLAFPTNIRPGWKSLPRKNTLAYNENLSIAAVKIFTGLSSGHLDWLRDNKVMF